MSMICKFRLWEKAERAPYDGAKPDTEARVICKFSAVKDEVFGPYTPAGSLEMTVVKSSGDTFVLGREYYLRFDPVEALTVTTIGDGRVAVLPAHATEEG